MPVVEAPEKAAAGHRVEVAGEGFKAGARVEIVLDSPRHEVVGSAVTRSDGTFRTSVTLPKASRSEARLQVVGTAANGKRAELHRVILVVASQDVASSGGDGLAKPVLLTLVGIIPLTTWLLLEVLGWRSRRAR
jgi:ribosomal protein L1